MNHTALRKIAAATAVICDQNGGSVDMFFLLKALYLADRQMLADYGAPITGDTYSSMPKGPILRGAYDLLKQSKSLGDAKAQAEWNSAFTRTGNTVCVKAGAIVDTDCLAPVEEDILREKIALVMRLDADGVNVAAWMHENCPEWEEVPEGSSKPIRMDNLLVHVRKVDQQTAKEIEKTIQEGLTIRRSSLLSASPVLRVA